MIGTKEQEVMDRIVRVINAAGPKLDRVGVLVCVLLSALAAIRDYQRRLDMLDHVTNYLHQEIFDHDGDADNDGEIATMH